MKILTPHMAHTNVQFQGNPGLAPQTNATAPALPEKTAMPQAGLLKVYFGAKEIPPNAIDTLSAAERKQVAAYGERYKDFIAQSVCAPWTAKNIIEMAEKNGFRPFPEDDTIKVKPGDKFYVNQDHQSVALIVIGENDPVKSGFNVVGAHMDSPQLELKPNPVLEKKGMLKLQTKPHGGGLWSTWMNRYLGIAGRVWVPVLDAGGKQKTDPETGRPMSEEKFVRLENAGVVIPLEAIHLNRTQNDGRGINKENDMNPLTGISKGTEDSVSENVIRILKEKAGIDLEKATRAELFLFPADGPKDVGVDGSMILGQGHDDRSMCYAAAEAIIEAGRGKNPPKTTAVTYFFDNEENGSQDRGGATSRWVESVAGRIVQAHPKARYVNLGQAREKALANSFIFSADVAHAWEPNHGKFHDDNNAVYLGRGPAIKADTNGHYATTGKGLAMAEDIFKRAGIPYQVANARQDIPCGTTIGPMIAANTSALTVDVGAAILSMHSAEEVASTGDLYLTKKAFASFLKGE